MVDKKVQEEIWKKAYDAERFNVGDVVVVSGTMRSGIGEIFQVCYYKKGELPYGFDIRSPKPQVGVKFEDGQKIVYNAFDILDGKLKKTDLSLHLPKTLEEVLKNTIIKRDFDFAPDSITLWEDTEDLHDFFKPLLNKEVYLKEYKKEVDLCEFDRFTYRFSSILEGVLMRNSGVPAFVLKLMVDGYAPTTFDLSISEVYCYGKEEEEVEI